MKGILHTRKGIRTLRRRSKIFIICLLFMILPLPILAFANTSIGEPELTQATFQPVQDTYIQHDYPYFDPFHHPSNYNYGGGSFLFTASGGQSNHPRILLQFDLSSIPKNAEIQSANLKLYCYSGGTWKSVGCYSLDQSWVEGNMNQQKDPPREIANGCTWNTHDGVNNWKNPGGDYNDSLLLDEIFIADDYDRGWKTWDVGTALRSWINGGLPNNGLILKTLGCANYWGASFYSKDYSEQAYRPKLEVVYELPEESLIENLSTTPSVFNPYQNGSQIEISYGLKQESLIQIEVYSSEGKRVKSLFEDFGEDGKEIEKPVKQDAGIHSEKWCGVIDFQEMTALDGDKGVLLSPDGEYSIKLIAQSISTGKTESAETTLEINSNE